MNTTKLALAACLLCSTAALADDGSASLGVGGLQFGHNDAVQMQSEDLFLSMDQVKIRYTFKNLTDKDVTVPVSFPLPDLGPEFAEEPVGVPHPEAANFVGFRVTVNGKPTAFETEQKAYVNAKDVTARVKAAGLPLSPVDPKWNGIEKKLSLKQADELAHDGIIDFERNQAGTAIEYIHPAWTLKTLFTRTQTFPAGKSVEVRETYAPVAGGSVQSLLLSPGIEKDSPDLKKLIGDYCIDESFQKAAQRLAKSVGYEHVQEANLDYILKSGATWAGPIGKFHLTLDKGRRTNLMSLCIDGIKQTAPTRFEVTKTNFTPDADIHVLFLVPSK